MKRGRHGAAHPVRGRPEATGPFLVQRDIYMSDRAEQVLSVADALYGAITMPVVAAIFPGVTPTHLRRLMADLVARGAMVPAWAGGTGRRVWLTTRSASGRVAGLRKWLADSDAVRGALMTKNAGTIQPPVTFLHAQIAGQIVAGFGICERVFDSELHTGEAVTMADGIACPEPDFRLLIEAERMVRQGAGRWKKRDGLVDKIVSEFGQSREDGALVQHLVAAPKFGGERAGERVDFEQELARLVAEKASGMAGVPHDAGHWFLPEEHLEADPTWHPIFPGVEAPRPLPGIASRRAAFAAEHAKNAALDRARKARAKAAAAGIPLPAGVTVLPASASSTSANPTTP